MKGQWAFADFEHAPVPIDLVLANSRPHNCQKILQMRAIPLSTAANKFTISLFLLLFYTHGTASAFIWLIPTDATDISSLGGADASEDLTKNV